MAPAQRQGRSRTGARQTTPTATNTGETSPATPAPDNTGQPPTRRPATQVTGSIQHCLLTTKAPMGAALGSALVLFRLVYLFMAL